MRVERKAGKDMRCQPPLKLARTAAETLAHLADINARLDAIEAPPVLASCARVVGRGRVGFGQH